MRAAIYEAFEGPITVRDLPDPVPEADGVVIRVEATGICRSDWHGWMGHDPDIRLPHVPGHELAGVIETVGREVTRWLPGDRVTLPFVCGCGRCPQCQDGHHQVCDQQVELVVGSGCHHQGVAGNPGLLVGDGVARVTDALLEQVARSDMRLIVGITSSQCELMAPVWWALAPRMTTPSARRSTTRT